MKPSRSSAQRVPNSAPSGKPESRSSTGQSSLLTERLFAFALGLWIGLSLLKFGNPIIFDRMIVAPHDLAEFIFVSWPVAWGYVLLGFVILAALPTIRPFCNRRLWPAAFLIFWLFWQFLSAARSIDPKLSNPTLVHFVACVAAFFLGLWALGRVRASGWFWVPVLLAFGYVLFNGFDQHNGGLEATRKAFYEQPNWQRYPKEYLLKMESNRIFSTLVYPNTLAGVILLLLPIGLWETWQLTIRWRPIYRGVLAGLLGYLALACLYWTGSKGGWLVGLILAAVIFMHLSASRRLKITVISVGISLGLVAFFLRFSGYFQKGATSVGARFSYWDAAFKNAIAHPVLGTGPGTFSVVYRDLKRPDEEMAKLTHNDYLEQASDSGVPGMVGFALFVAGSLVQLYRNRPAKDWSYLLLWVGLLGWSMQAFIEFSLYIPATAWPVFLWFGYLSALAQNQGKVYLR